jgi:hypothetical protein
VFSFDDALAPVMARIGRRIPGLRWTHGGGALALGEAVRDGEAVRLVATRLIEADRTLVFLLAQSAAERAASAGPPAEHLLAELPPYPGSEPTFFARDDRTHMSLAVAASVASAPRIQAFYRNELTAAGWVPALPAGGGAQALQLYVREGHLCGVLVHADEEPGQNRIAVLHKRFGQGRGPGGGAL